MDQITHELRLADWQTIVTNCLSRPAGQSKKQWLAEHNVLEKSYYYWQRKLLRLVHDEGQSESSAMVSSDYEFAEIPFRMLQENSPEPSSAPVAVIRAGSIVVELNNSISDHLLGRILEVISHA